METKLSGYLRGCWCWEDYHYSANLSMTNLQPPTPKPTAKRKIKPSEIIKEYVERTIAEKPIEPTGIDAIDILARHVAKLAAHADAIDKFLDIAYSNGK